MLPSELGMRSVESSINVESETLVEEPEVAQVLINALRAA